MQPGDTYKNGQLKLKDEGDVRTFFFKDGTIKARGPFREGKMQGQWTFYREGGILWQQGDFKDDQKHGDFKRWHPDGKLEYHAIFEHGKLKQKIV